MSGLTLAKTGGGIKVIQPRVITSWSLKSRRGKSQLTSVGNFSGGTFLDMAPTMVACSLSCCSLSKNRVQVGVFLVEMNPQMRV